MTLAASSNLSQSHSFKNTIEIKLSNFNFIQIIDLKVKFKPYRRHFRTECSPKRTIFDIIKCAEFDSDRQKKWSYHEIKIMTKIKRLKRK